MILQSDPKQTVISLAQSFYDEGYACSQAVLMAYSGHFELDLRTAKLISSAFGGGMGHLRHTCGAVTGSFMVLGLAYGNENAEDRETKQKAYSKVRELHQQVEAIHGTVNCKELLQKHATQGKAEERKQPKIFCRRIVGQVAGLLYDQLNRPAEI